MAFIYHVTYKKKKMRISTNDKSDVVNEIMKQFNCGIIQLQKEDDLFPGEWIDVENLRSLSDKCRLLAFDEEENFDIEWKDAKHSTAICNEENQFSDDDTMPYVPSETSQSKGVTSSSSSEVSQSEPSTVDWIVTYELPQFPITVQEALEDSSTTSHQVKELLPQIIDALYYSIAQHTLYPGLRNGYGHVSMLLIRKFPILAHQLDKKNPHRDLVNKLKAKFKYKRSSLVTDPKVISMKRKYGLSSNGTRKKKKENSEDTTEGILPTPEPSQEPSNSTLNSEGSDLTEDKTTMAEKRLLQDDHEISALMKSTLSKRRKAIDSGLSTVELLQEYPYLKIINYMCDEATDIACPTKSAFRIPMHAKLSYFLSGRILDKLKTLTEAETAALKHEEDFSEMEKVLLLLPSILKEDPVNIYDGIFMAKASISDKAQLFPHLTMKDRKIFLEADNVEICAVDSLKEGVAGMVALYWVLNVEIPKWSTKTIKFLAWVMGLVDKLPTSLENLSHYLTK